MEFEHLMQLITAVSDSGLTDFSYEENGAKIRMKKEKETLCISSLPQAAPSQTLVMEEAAFAGKDSKQEEGKGISGKVVTSPLVGTFYSSASPKDEPYVKAGDLVSKGQTLGIVEAMKLMNEIESEYDGAVKEILVSNGDVIEFGQPLFVIE